MKVNLLGDWINGLQQEGYYSFLRKEVPQSGNLSSEAVKKSLQRLTKKKRIVKVTDTFYALVPTEYMNAGSPPVSWFIDHFMISKGRPYYVALLSIASLHGASHHQPQEFQVITNAPIRALKIGRQRIRFFTKGSVEDTPTTEVKTPTGMIRVSSPEATVLDLVRFSKASGYLGNVATILHDLADKLDATKLVEAADKHGEFPTVQRLGYLLDLVYARSLADAATKNWLKKTVTGSLHSLRRDRSIVNARRDSRWNILVNDNVEVES